jgi:hypothetical protein
VSNVPRSYNKGEFFASAAAVNPGEYYYYENDGIPSYLRAEQHQRTPNANKGSLIVATVWSAGAIGGVTPQGTTYLVFDYADHAHHTTDLHFNKEVKFYFKDNRGNPFLLTMNKDIDGHYINAVATGTALSYLRSEYKLPKQPHGSISNLLDEGTSFGPYPTE